MVLDQKKRKQAGALVHLCAGPLLLLLSLDPVLLQARPCTDCGYNQAGWQKLSSLPGQGLPGELESAPLPSEMDLSPLMPPAGYQGDQASCISWSAVYAVKSYYENRHRQWGFDSPYSGGPGHHVFSPAFSHAMIGGGDRGATFPDALDVLLRTGAVPWSEMPYRPDKPATEAPSRLNRLAREFRIEGYRILSSHSPEAIKRQVAAGDPVMVGILLYESLLDLKNGTYEKTSGEFLGGHSLVIVGYDDDRGQGAFLVLNSWGKDWGMDGLGWISYDAMSQMIRTALVIEEEVVDATSPAPENLPSPEQIHASRGSSSQNITLNWSTVETALAYEIQRAPVQEDGPEDFRTVGFSTGTYFRDSTVDPGRPYAYRILALDEKGRSDESQARTVTGYASREPDFSTTVELLQGRIEKKGTQIYALLSWREGEFGAEIQRWNDTRQSWDSLGTTRASHFKDYRISPGARYTYRMRPVAGGIRGLWSRPVVLSSAGEKVPPSIVTGLQVSRGSLKGRIELSWDAAPGVKAYLVYRYNPATKSWEGPYRTIEPRFQDVNGLQPGEWYGYRIVAVNSAGAGPGSPVVYGRTSPELTAERSLEGLSNPAGLTLEPKPSGGFELSWKPVSGAIQYDVLSAELPGNDYRTVATIPAGSPRPVHTFSMEESGARAYRVLARGELQKSLPSEPIIAVKNPEPIRQRWFGLDSNPWTKEGVYRATDWKSDGLVHYTLRLKEESGLIQATLEWQEGKRTFALKGPGASRTLVSSGVEFIRSSDGRYIELIEHSSPGFHNGRLLFVAQ